jgi:hypothetical protein
MTLPYDPFGSSGVTPRDLRNSESFPESFHLRRKAVIFATRAAAFCRFCPDYGWQLPAAKPAAERILEINSLQAVTKAVVEAARESLVIGQA